ncbi:MAG: BON domain-containing protein [Betaproteobacteria bacterium]|jgi:osmotically-inducible protein OsmY
MTSSKTIRSLVLLLAAGGASVLGTGCAPLLVGGAVAGGVIVATDRRSVGIQVEDEAIEGRVSRALGSRFFDGNTHRISVNAYNRRVLLTGEVPSEADKAEAGKLAAAMENVRVVSNELVIGTVSTQANRNNDAAITTKVRAALLAEKNVPSGTVSVTTRRSVVYLMGRVSAAEGDLAARAASRVEGVREVVKLFDLLSESEIKAIKPAAAPAAAPAAESQRK